MIVFHKVGMVRIPGPTGRTLVVGEVGTYLSRSMGFSLCHERYEGLGSGVLHCLELKWFKTEL